ncbi:uncharacterized protein Z520_03783 [Fonsecaea multimorphosa CBS 102226]|uniref:Uncharacterized protein n=1 Tax=Fonsecaea multimorphosa CBS 102226 TaxID=1442371 RepID=A0A0D2K2L9_9EURO|nr:uncharacterized protein Z520_03783 [Fonsecaea multimorphosa CBS 102226]KIY00098.1 hypothetical protein Z520_03783 [Fonsecaea multimorphosa CBS 102226]OAL27295.1 hypothetical protein AYO22_03570 [Fonsecaea multimorphosa]
MDYHYYNDDYYYDDYNDYDEWDGEYGGDDYDYDESYWGDDYWDHEESPEYYHQQYYDSQRYAGDDRSYDTSEEYYGSQFGGYHDGYNQGYSRGGNYQYTEGAMHTQSGQLQHYYGSNSWSVSTEHHSHSHTADHHTSRHMTLALPTSPTPPLLSIRPESPSRRDISVVSVLRTGTPVHSSGFTSASRALDINRNKSLSVKPIDSQSTKSARTPTPTESFFHNLFWKSPVRPRARTRPTTPVVPPSSRHIPQSPNLTATNMDRPSSAAGTLPIAGYDATRGRDIGFLAPSPEQT